MIGRLAVMAILALVAPALAQDKLPSQSEKAPPKTITLHLDASKLPPEVLAQLMKLAEEQKGGPKKGEFVKLAPRKGAPGAATSLGHAAVLLEKKGHTVVKAESAGGVFTLHLADGGVVKLEAVAKGRAPDRGFTPRKK